MHRCSAMLAVSWRWSLRREEAHRQLMWALAVAGQRTAALAQFNQCRQVLLAELGVEPDTATVELYEQIPRWPA